MSSFIGKLHDFTGSDKATPELRLTHSMLDGVHKSSTKAVNMTSDGLATTADKWGWSSSFPRYWEERSGKDNKNFGRWGENSIGGAAAVVGGAYGYQALAGEGAASGTAGVTGSNGAFLGEGVGSGIGAWDGAAGGAGLGVEGGTFNPNGMPQGSSYASDFPTKGGGWSWADGLSSVGSSMQSKGKGKEPDDEPVKPSEVEFEKPSYAEDPYAYSSKRLKTGPRASMRAVMARGAAGGDVIDQNGVHMAAIQALTAKVVAAKARLDQLKGKRA